MSKIPATCTTAKFKRGSVLDLPAGSGKNAVSLMGSRLKILTKYGDPGQPLPKFVKPHQPTGGAVFSSFSAITIDRLYVSGAHSE